MSQGKSRGRSVEAKARRMEKWRRVSDNGRRIVCDTCKSLHVPPECESTEPAQLSVRMPEWLYRELSARVADGERSPWVVRQIRKGLGV